MKSGVTYTHSLVCALLLGASLWAAVACEPSSEEPLSCPESPCAAGTVCLQSLCVSESSDPDNDQLETGKELAAGLDPLCADTDADGIPDGVEWGSGTAPRDRDQDGIPDALESQDADEDGDCVPDVWDAEPDVASDAPSGWVDTLCSSLGVCGLPGTKRSLVCSGGVAQCVVSGTEAFERVETLCDGLDNDCDGFVDEALWWNNAPVGASCWGAGACGLGHVECNLQTFEPTCSSLADGSESRVTEEACDGLDNDCDSVTDEGMTFDGASLGEPCTGKGQCGEGVVVCDTSKGEATCSSMPGGGESEASTEVCDGEDNDCDGLTDEGVTPPAVTGCPTKGVCAKPGSNPSMECVEGGWLCVFAGVESYEPLYERTCDGLDNDCDGSVDEEFALLGNSGVLFLGDSCGLGPCSGGVVLCASDGNGVVCSTASNASEEVCDGLDNDCDGVADNGQTYLGKSVGEPCKGVGACGAGVVACASNGEASCSTNPGMPGSEARTELCDLLDNDCDGEVDKGLDEGPSCKGVGACSDSLDASVCIGGHWLCDYSAVAGYEASEQSCDGVDNDCDGRVDEGTDATYLGAAVAVSQEQPAHRAGYVAVADQTGLTLVGGAAQSLDGLPVCLGDWWRKGADGAWVMQQEDAIPARHDAAAVLRPQGDGVLVLGGRCGEQVHSDAWMLTDEGAAPLDVPAAVASRYGHAVFAEAEKGDWLVVGGKTESGAYASAFNCSADWQCSDPLPGFPSLMGAASCVDSLANRAYLFGGQRPDGSYSSTLVRIDLLTLQVVSFEPAGAPEGRVGASLWCRGDSVYLAGGVNDEGEVLSDTWLYSAAGQQWAQGNRLARGESNGVLREAPLGGVQLWLGVNEEGAVEWGEGVDWQGGQWGASLPGYPRIGAGASFAYDPFSGVTCATGGVESTSASPRALAGVWCRDGDSTWWLAGELSSPLLAGASVYDPYRDRFLHFGGVASGHSTDGAPVECRAEWFSLSGDRGQLEQCAQGSGPHGFAGAWAVLAPEDLLVYVLGGRSAAEAAALGLWTLDLESEEWTQASLPVELETLRIEAVQWEEASKSLWLMGEDESGYAVVQWRPGQSDVTAWIPVDVDLAGAAFWLDETAREFLLISGSGNSYLLFDQALPVSGLVPAALEGEWPAGRLLTWGTSWVRREAWSLGQIDSRGLTQPTEITVQMTCQ